MPPESINESIIYLLELSGTGLTDEQANKWRCQMAAAGLSAKSARNYMSTAKRHWDNWRDGAARGAALSSIKQAQAQMIAAVEQACKAVSDEIKARPDKVKVK